MSADIVAVTGGAGGIAATYDEIRALADAFDATGDELRAWSGAGLRSLADPDLVSSAPLSPVTFAAAEAAVVAATAGPDGLLPASAEWEADAVLIRAAVTALEASDDAARAAMEVIDWQLGRTVGLALEVAGPGIAVALATMSPAARARLGTEAQGCAVRHPRVVQHLVNGGGGLLGLPGNRVAARLAGALYADGEPVTTRRDDLRVPAGDRPPGSVTDLVGHLQEVAALSPEPNSRDNGTIEVQTLDAGTDHARHIVYLPGTDDLGTLPWTADGDVRDLGTDLRSDAGETTAYQRGILQAMSDAGIGPHDPVLLVGHSLGGMEAAALAARHTGFAITDVVTAGSPTAQVPGFPDGVHVLSLEHRGDVVPLLDGADNRDTVNQTTVTFADGVEPSVVAMHDYPHYVAGAEAVDASTDPSVAAFRDGLHDRGFLGTTGVVRSQVFQVVRAPH